ncbi:MAG: type IV secretory system conjugative DNA transfer family protein [Hydrogenoanaerobacterium sp.]
MFKLDNGERRIAAVFLFTAMYLIITGLFLIPQAQQGSPPGLAGFLLAIPSLWYIKVPVAAIFTFVIFLLPSYNLENIKAKDVGDGQHGKARWATDDEIKNTYEVVRQGKEKTPGFVLGQTKGGQWIIDISDMSALLIGPPGCGKTTREILPTVMYNGIVNKNTKGNGASMIITDLMGDVLRLAGNFLEKNGYENIYLNLRFPFQSYFFNLLNNVNKHMESYLAADNERDRLIFFGKAERYAKTLAQSIVYNTDTQQSSDASAYFNETAQGLITGIVLLVSEYATQKDQKHILSVFNLIIELNGVSDEQNNNPNQRNKLHDMLEHVQNERIKQYVGPAMSADFRSSMNIFSSALGKLVGLIDAELEQMISRHSQEIDDISFIEKPTAIFIICPDENPTRYFFATLFMRYFLNDLIEQARTGGKGKLPRQVFCLWDEFGNMPPIKNVDTLFSATRSAGIRIMPALQSLGQLQKSYNANTAKIIRETCQITVTTYVAPQAYDTAKEISQSLGNRTVQGGSVSMGKGGQQTVQMMAKPLLSPDEIMRLKQGEFVVMKSGAMPMLSHLPYYADYLPTYENYVMLRENEVLPISRMTEQDVKNITGVQFKLHMGMFG